VINPILVQLRKWLVQNLDSFIQMILIVIQVYSFIPWPCGVYRDISIQIFDRIGLIEVDMTLAVVHLNLPQLLPLMAFAYLHWYICPLQ
jgi:hypothetical protein